MTTQTPNMRVEPWSYQITEGQPWVGGINLLTLAEQHGTPLYVLDGAGIKTMAQAYQQAIQANYSGEALVLFACKANMTTGLAQRMHQMGLGLDVVSGGEVYTAHKAGVPMEKLFFNGNNKSLDELTLALTLGVGHITVDNLTELDLLAETALKLGKRAKILMRITPGIDCHTHDYIRTGQVDSKFGFNLSDLDAALTAITGPYAQAIQLCGLHAHIGSQIFERQPYLDLVDVLLGQYQHIRQTYGLILPQLNIGGGLGIAYTLQDDPLNVGEVLTAVCQHLTRACQQADYPLPRLLLEPGRSMVATSGVTLYRIGSRKIVPDATTYLAIDGGMGDNIRPSLYGARYTAVVANRLNEPADTPVTIAGKYCESGDVLIRDLMVPASTTRDDVLLVFGTGAYNYSMASTYNRVPRPAMVWVEAGQATTLVRRETYDDLLALDV